MTTISLSVTNPSGVRSSVATHPVAAAWRQFCRWLQSVWCVVNGGHYKVLHTEPDKMALRCVACGHMSPGWNVGSPRLARRVPADRERLRAVRRPMVA